MNAWVGRRLAPLLALAAALVACGVGAGAWSSAAGASASSGSGSSKGTVWLCRPGTTPDPCAGDLATTVVSANGARAVEPTKADPSSSFDCFYVYPTVSTQPGDNANLKIQPAERAAARAQAALFSQECRVWAPMYRQRTAASLAKGLGNDHAADLVAYHSLLSAWDDYLRADNHGRPIVFIGHSQGAAMLIRLLASQVDDVPRVRDRLVVAILLGGNVTVPDGTEAGATFRHIPVCTAPAQTGCTIAYSSFPSEPPAQAEFGRPGQGVSLQSSQTKTAGVHVACVNPAAIGGGTADLTSAFPATGQSLPAPPVTTPFVLYPDRYSATCEEAGGATWLQVTPVASTADVRPVVEEQLGPDWGYHTDDVNLALGNLVADVAAEEAAWRTSHR